jgi:LmbE family N-acetylglucosaminyl deacetylase
MQYRREELEARLAVSGSVDHRRMNKLAVKVCKPSCFPLLRNEEKQRIFIKKPAITILMCIS